MPRCGPPANASINLKQIPLALHSYHEKYGSLPPAYVADASGRPMHSWRVLILPFLERESLYDQYDFREPWDGPNNIQLLGSMPHVFACPSRSPDPKGMTSYVAITGPGTMFPGATSVKFADVTDGLPDTLMVVETANVDIPWTAPDRPRHPHDELPDQRPEATGHLEQAPRRCQHHLRGRTRLLPEGRPRRRCCCVSLITIAGGDGNPYDDGTRSY